MRRRTIKKQLWLNEEENKKLKENSRRTGLSESSYIRQLILGFKPKKQPTEIIYEMMNQVRVIGNNLNQISRKENALGMIDVPYYKHVYEKNLQIRRKIE